MVFGGNIGSWDPVVSFSSLLGASSAEVSRAACSSLSQTVCAPRFRCLVKDSWSFAVRGSLSTAPAITCVASFIVAEGTSPPCSRLGGRPSTPRWRLSSLALRPSPRDANVERWVGRDLRGQHLDLLGSPPCSRDADESFRVLSSVSPRDEQGRKSSCRIEAGRHAPDDGSKACHPQSTLVTHRGSCWPDVLRRCPHDVAVTCIPWRAPLVAEAPKSISSHHPCKHGWCASVDSRLPMGIDAGARASGPLSPKT